MQEIKDWIIKNKKRIILLVIICLVLPLLIVHMLFSMTTSITWLQAKWSAGELISYIGSIEMLFGTIALGVITVYQSNKANEISLKLSKENNRLQQIIAQDMYPIVEFKKIKFERAIANSSPNSTAIEFGKGISVNELVTPTERRQNVVVLFEDAHENASNLQIFNVTVTNISKSVIKKNRI